jgi:zeta-carotene desaturase
MYDVIIIGGGLSGLAATVKLSLAGIRVALFEKSPKLGGRCYSYIDKKTGDVVDNGQHVLLGAYHNLLHYLDLINTKRLLKCEPALSMTFYHPIKGQGKFEIPSLPKPFHLTAGMLKFKLLSFKDRQHLLKVGMDLNNRDKESEKRLRSLTIEEWLVGLKQSEEARKSLWYPIAVSVMNESPDKASALLFARALRAAFLGKKSDSAILIPQVGQTELYVQPAEELLAKHEAKIFTNTEVDSIEVNGGKVTGIYTLDGKHVKAGNVISTIPHYALQKIIPKIFGNEPPFIHLEKLKLSPIISIHFWFDSEFMEIDYLGLIDKNIQWIFNRRRIMNETHKSTGFICAVISGAHDYIDMPKEKLLSLAMKDIHDIFPDSRRAKLTHSIIIKERSATFSPTPAVEPFRCSTETSIKNFYLAGDWTNTGYPATIEGAVMSGFRAAELVIKQ